MTYSKQEINLITLASFEEITLSERLLLLENYTKTEPDFNKYREKLIKTLTEGVYNKVRGRFYDADYRTRFLNYLDKKGIACVTYFSEGYPELLKEIPNPPAVLFCKGDRELLKNRCLTVVGSRRTTAQALGFCKKLAGEITTAFTLVTGSADGADTAAATGALAEGGKVICTLAHGFDFVYPASNEKLFKKVEKEGLLISEYPPYVSPKTFQFPARNRSIAEGTLVISAAKKSGALITAEYAYNFGRSLFAVPYTPGVSSGEGCNALIKKGATLCENILDIFGEFGLDFNKSEAAALSEDESKLLAEVKALGEAFVGDLAQKLNVPAFKLIPLLSALEIKGLVVRLGGNRYSAT